MVRFSWVLLYSSGLIVYVGRSPPYLLVLGFHADADAAGTYYLFRICFLHVIVFLFIYFHTCRFHKFHFISYISSRYHVHYEFLIAV